MQSQLEDRVDAAPSVTRELAVTAYSLAGRFACEAVLDAAPDDRLDVFWQRCRHVPDRAYWHVIRRVWQYESLPALGYPTWHRIWTEHRASSRPLAMTWQERTALLQVADHRLYRGYTGDDWRGLSWTPQRRFAERIAIARFDSGPGIGWPMHVASVHVHPHQVLALLRDHRQGITEILLDPSELTPAIEDL